MVETTDDPFWRRQILATHHQLAQPVLKIGSAQQKGWDRGRWMGVPLWLTVHGGGCSCL